MKTALITGAGGQDAFYLTKLLLSKKYKVILTTRRKETSFLNKRLKYFNNIIEEKNQLQYFQIDYLNKKMISDLITQNKVDEIYNLTGHSNVVTSFKTPNLVKDEPKLIFDNFIDAIKTSTHEVKLFQAATSEIFKDQGSKLLNEKSETNALTPYAIGKLNVFNELKTVRKNTGLYLVSGIMFNHESLIRNSDYLFGYIANGIKKIINGETDKIFISNLNTVRDWGYSEEFVKAMWLSLNYKKPDDYIISTGKSYSVERILQEAFSIVNLDYRDFIIEKFNESRSYDVEKKYSDPTKIFENLSWKADLDGVDIIKKKVDYEINEPDKASLINLRIPETKMVNVYQPSINKSDKNYILNALNDKNLSGASLEVKLFEDEFKKKFNFSYCLAVNNGTAALHLGLMSLGIGQGDEVIIPSLTFIATANAVTYVGAKPIIVDVNPKTLQISVNEIKSKITKKTKAIIPVHLYGNSPDLDAINNLAQKHNLYVVHDAAEALGTKYNKKPSGAYKDIAIYSFYPNKLITTGEGGMLVTTNKKTYEIAKKIRSQGVKKNADEYIHDVIGYNYRMNSLSAALGRSQLSRMDSLLDRKKEIHSRYRTKLEKHGISFIETENNIDNSFWLTVLIFKSSKISINKLREYLFSYNIETKKIFFPIERQKMYKQKKFNENSYKIYQQSLCVPSSPDLKNKDIDFISQKIIEFINPKQ